MLKQRAVTLCGCLAALPLLMGCADGGGGPPQAYSPALQAYSPALQAYSPAPQAYSPAPPAAPWPMHRSG